MAGAGLLALIDDIATILDDVAIMSKMAAKKTAGLVGDDLALNAKGLTGINPEREIPVVLAVAKGSFINKVILVPAAIITSTFAPWLITPLLMFGGAYLCFEGVEKVLEKLFHGKDHSASEKHKEAEFIKNPVNFEKDKIKGAIRTDFILSAEIIVIALGAVTEASLGVRIGVLSVIGVGITVGIYGVVAGLIKLDDLGLYLMNKGGQLKSIGQGIVNSVPYIMKTIGIIGTLAMFIVGGEIIMHGIHPLEEFVHHLFEDLDGIVGFLAKTISAIIIGIISGLLVIPAFKLLYKTIDRIKEMRKAPQS